jgi:peptidoglycan-associated lipoprotein
MKNSILLAVMLGCGLAIVGGCKPKERVTPLNQPTGSATSRDPNLNTDPLAKGGSASAAPLDLPSEENLKDRDFDRAAFASQTVYFDFDQATVRTAEASKLEQVAGAFKAKGPGHDLLIEGHCDERGTEEYNRSLGERRALAMRELLIKSGLDGQHIYTRTFGKDKPAIVGHDESAWSKNRRGEFILVLPKKITTTQNSQ